MSDRLSEAPFDTSPEAFCQYMVKRISDPSTVRVRCIEYFGRAPNRERITQWRQGHEAKLAKFKRQAERRGMQL